MSRRRKPPIRTNPSHDLHQCVLEYFQTLRVPLSAAELDAALAQGEKKGGSPLEFLSRLLGPQADLHRQRAIERIESAQAASLLYKVVDSRGPKRSTALVTNISFEAWADYLGDAPLAMAILDRLVDGAIVLKIEGRSYRAHRAQQPAVPAPAEIPKSKRRRKLIG